MSVFLTNGGFINMTLCIFWHKHKMAKIYKDNGCKIILVTLFGTKKEKVISVA